ncbi:MAG: sigma-54-dependent transcriptional regulator [Desulfurivibrionaceae bacterium]|jgi:two-component system nitrogen regulation response regulator NtrX|nr:sigma-54 dependent transcriptional regulator [Pseudomonadota bacterium]MBU4230516.1 sigma-54 dependent transcriptional regulator [Pseudomonadota bacterium]MCG2823364.1 sigma-54 dependent transcriptional regulator [Desulfobulbaceae bacterium]MDP2002704.1 sigma-54 dependent transcriptional regulator [Desulfurivibrionaceae bacterium]
MAKTILIIDDEASIRESLSGILADEGFLALSAEDGQQGLSLLEDERVDLVLLDIWMPGLDGLEVLKRIKETQAELPVIMISGHGTIETAVQATKMGAYDFIEKPPSYDKIILSINNALDLARLKKENLILRQQTQRATQLTGNSPAMVALRQLVERVAPTEAWVLIRGEHGTGKELVAQSIHRLSKNAAKPMIELNCAAIPEELIESELFGHEKGSFTGATASRRGKFDLADGTTLFLDEIGDMSLKTQAKVLRILQEQKFERVGGSKTIQVEVRVLAATNKDLEQEIENGAFRADLFYRLNVVPIQVPPLRERREDLPLLVADFVADNARKGLGEKEFSTGALQAMMRHAWPGNVRELRNFVERVMIMCPAETVDEAEVVRLLGIAPGEDAPSAAGVDALYRTLSYKEAKKIFERDFLKVRLAGNEGNISQTAEQIGLERSHLHRKMKSLSLGEE